MQNRGEFNSPLFLADLGPNHNYRFNDFLKIGTPLNLIIWIAASFIIPLFFPF